MVHPVPDPFDDNIEKITNMIEDNSNQKLKLFIRGKAISHEIKTIGINQFPNPPIIIGITIKKIIIKAWDVTIEL